MEFSASSGNAVRTTSRLRIRTHRQHARFWEGNRISLNGKNIIGEKPRAGKRPIVVGQTAHLSYHFTANG
jgi:hypothetical protein